jgi:hypothetical protein
MDNEQGLRLLNKAYEVNLWLTRHSLRMPRGLRFSLGQRLQTAATELCLALVNTRYAKRIDRPLARADARLGELRLLVRMALDLEAISERQFGFISEHIAELGRQLGGWRRSLL